MTYAKADGYKIRNQSVLHFLTFTIMGWIDIFTRQCYRDLMLDSFRFCQEKKGLKIGAWVIMSNHIHTICRAEHNNLSDIIRDFKTFTCKAIYEMIQKEKESRREWLNYMFSYFANGTNANKQIKIWTNNNHPEEIFSQDFLKTKMDYIHNNPVRAGLVFNASDYIYSSAMDYEGKKGLIDLSYLE